MTNEEVLNKVRAAIKLRKVTAEFYRHNETAEVLDGLLDSIDSIESELKTK